MISGMSDRTGGRDELLQSSVDSSIPLETFTHERVVSCAVTLPLHGSEPLHWLWAEPQCQDSELKAGDMLEEGSVIEEGKGQQSPDQH